MHLPAICLLNFSVLFICLLSGMKWGLHQQKWQRAALEVPEDVGMGGRSILKFAFTRHGAGLLPFLRESQQREHSSLCAQCFPCSFIAFTPAKIRFQRAECVSILVSQHRPISSDKEVFCFSSFEAKCKTKPELQVIVLWCGNHLSKVGQNCR